MEHFGVLMGDTGETLRSIVAGRHHVCFCFGCCLCQPARGGRGIYGCIWLAIKYMLSVIPNRSYRIWVSLLQRRHTLCIGRDWGSGPLCMWTWLERLILQIKGSNIWLVERRVER